MNILYVIKRTNARSVPDKSRYFELKTPSGVLACWVEVDLGHEGMKGIVPWNARKNDASKVERLGPRLANPRFSFCVLRAMLRVVLPVR